MLSHLFTSQTRVKLLETFLLNPEGEYFVRELTRKLSEQINSIRRELDNLKKLGLLKCHTKNRKKYYAVNKNFVLFNDLRNIILKAQNSTDSLVKSIQKVGQVDFLLISGVFLQKDAPVDLLVVGNIDKENLSKYLDTLETKDPIRFSLLKKDDFLYRIKCADRFIVGLIEDTANLVGVDKIGLQID
ncbi:MAG: hypothetical protein WC846_02165 [Candidatus Gracilibacteria bacterium]|jgi:hypothetical protein